MQAETVGITISAHVAIAAFSWEFGISASLGVGLNMGLPMPHHEGASTSAGETCIFPAPGTEFLQKLFAPVSAAIQAASGGALEATIHLDIGFAIDYLQGDDSGVALQPACFWLFERGLLAFV